MDHKYEKILNKYLKEIEARLEEISYAARKEFIAEIRTHLVEKWESGETQNEESLLQVIDEFGDPGEIAEEYLAKSTGGGKPRESHLPPWLVVALTVFIWPVGIVLAWISPAWRLRDKIIATLIPILSLGLLLLATLSAGILYQYEPVIVEDIQMEVLD